MLDGLAFGFVALILLLLLISSGDCDLLLRAAFYIRDWADSHSFSGKTVWVTGASSGIGEACAKEFARRGARVVLSARRGAELKRVVRTCTSPEKHCVVALDLGDTASHGRVVQEVIDTVGKIDLLVNNAGRSQRSLVESTQLEVFEAQIKLNTLGTISLTQTLYPHLRPGAQIVTVTSIAGKLGSPGAAAYSASKFALQGFCEAFRIEAVCRGVNIGLVCPGPVVSEGGKNAITGSGSVAAMDPDTPDSAYDKRRMSTERCARLIACAARFRLNEVWISPMPELLITYLAQYTPAFYQRLALVLGPGRIATFKKKLS